MENDDLYRGLAAFLICFGQGLPEELKARIHQRTQALAEQMAHGGDTSAARVATGLSEALMGRTPM